MLSISIASLTSVELADLAAVSPPATSDSLGARYLRAVAEAVATDLAEIGPSLHAVCLRLAAEDAVPVDDEDAFGAFVDLALWDEELPTTAALEAAGVRLGASLVAAAAEAD